MAYTKIHAIKKTLKKALDYIENPKKTDGELLVSGYNIDPLAASIEFEMTAALASELKGNYTKVGGANNLAYHMIQSFSPTDNITPEQAHEIGKKLADEFLDGKYEYVISTHIDKDHIHNHIIFNSVSFYDFKKMNTQPFKTAAKIRAISDRLCTEHELSVIQSNQNLGHSYKEYLERKTNTSWKSEIRKKLNYILETAIDYDEFKSNALDLGVQVIDSRKHIKYTIEGHEKGVRGKKLSDTEQYTKDGILTTLENNKNSQILIKDSIKKAASKAEDYNHFVEILKEDFSIQMKQKSGIITYKIDDVNGNVIKERALGAAYTSDAIKKAIHKNNYEFIEIEEDHNIVDEFNKTVRTKVEERDTPIILNKDNISKITIEGILLEIPDEKGELGKVFIDNNHVDYLKNTDKYAIYLGSKYDYYFVNEKIDPDVLESQQLSGRYTKGENIIRTLEVQNGIKPTIIEISASDIKSVSNKGLTISMPDLDIGSIFIENKYVEYERIDGGSCKVKLYENWNYSYKKDQASKKNELVNIIGDELINIIKNRDLNKDESLVNKIAAMERRTAIKDTKKLADTLLLMRHEKIHKIEDFDVKIDGLLRQASGIKDTIKEIDIKNEQYKSAVKYLLAYNKYLPIKQEATKTFNKKKYEKKYESELNAFNHAATQLEKYGVNTNVDPDKVIALIKNQNERINELKNNLNEVENKIESFRDAQKVVKEVRLDKQKLEKENSKDRSER